MVKFLVIRFSSIGDIVLTTPVIRTLKKQVEGAQIIYLTKKQYAPVLEHNPYIDQLLLLEDNMEALISEVKSQQVDYIIDLHHNLRTSVLKRKLGLPGFSVDKINWQKWLIVNLNIDRLPKKHIVDRYLDTCRHFDVKADEKGLDYFLADNDLVNPSSIHPRYDKPYVALVMGAMHFTKQIPLNLLTDLCDGLDVPIMLLGGPADRDKGEELIQHSSNKNIVNACGNFSINQSASLVKQSAVVITPDTGLMHIAAAFQKPIISVWGNTIPDFGMYPYKFNDQSAMFEVADLKCRPCSKIGFQKCPKKHFNCMNQQNTTMIIAKAKRILNHS